MYIITHVAHVRQLGGRHIDEMIGIFHFPFIVKFRFYPIRHTLPYQFLWVLKLLHICNSILLYFLELAKKLSLFQTTYILPWAAVPYRQIFPIAHLLPALLVVRLALSL